MANITKEKTVPKIVTPKTQVSISDAVASKNLLTTMAAVLLVVLLLGGYFISMLSGRYIRQSNEIKAQDKEIGYLKKKKEDLAKLKVNYSILTTKDSSGKSDADLIIKSLPNTEDFKGLIASLENISQDSGVSMSTVKQSGGVPSSQSSEPSSLEGTVYINGSYDKIFTFLQNIERSSRVINFRSMSLKGTSGSISAEIGFRTYWQQPASIKSYQEVLK